jgi:hypothetical protein
MSPPLLQKVLKAPTDHEWVTALAELRDNYRSSKDPEVLLGLCNLARDKDLDPELRLGAFLVALEVAGVMARHWPNPPYNFNHIDESFDQDFLKRWGSLDNLPKESENWFVRLKAFFVEWL